MLLAAARRSLKLMQDFVKAQQELLKPGGLAAIIAAAANTQAAPAAAPAAAPLELPFEMVCAQVNNSVDCYNQSLEFTENVQVTLGNLPLGMWSVVSWFTWCGYSIL